MRTKAEIDNVLDQIDDGQSMGDNPRWPAMTYEQGVYNTLMWLTGGSEEDPFYED